MNEKLLIEALAKLASATGEAQPDLDRYAKTHGPGPERRAFAVDLARRDAWAVLKQVCRELEEVSP